MSRSVLYDAAAGASYADIAHARLEDATPAYAPHGELVHLPRGRYPVTRADGLSVYIERGGVEYCVDDANVGEVA